MAERMTMTEESSFKVTQLFGGNHRGIDLNINTRGIAKPPILLPEKAVRAVVDVVDNGSIEWTYGNWIQLTALEGEYKGWWMRACHMLQMSHLKKGDIVKVGDVIGYQGNTGNSFGAHVHWELGVPCPEFIPWAKSYLRAPYSFLGCPAKVGTYKNSYSVGAGAKPNEPTAGVSVGDIVDFIGGNVYVSAIATDASANKGRSKCKVTAIASGALHPYHCISEDGKGVYGWVDAAAIGVSETESAKMYNVAIGPVSIGDKDYLVAEAARLGVSVAVTEVG